MKRTLFTVVSSLVVLCFAVSAWATAPIRVDCSKEGSINKTLARLAQSGNTRGVTISVTGTCHENITITGFDHLVLQGIPGATIQDASNGSNTVVAVWSSNDVTLQRFTINGGSIGVWCGGSLCKLSSNTIQQSAGSGVSVESTNLYLWSNNILNNVSSGVDAEFGSNVVTSSNTISDNFRGFTVFAGSNLTASGDTIQQNNETSIVLVHKSFMRAINVTINNNKADGVYLQAGSTAAYSGGT
jgi:hypothetical protein